MSCWVRWFSKEPEFSEARAIIASPGLRSVGLLSLIYLIEKLKPTLLAKLYSTSFPVVHEVMPSYSPHPSARGRGGVFIQSGTSAEPCVNFYVYDNVLLVRGYQANFYGQRQVAEKTMDLLVEMNVKEVIGLAAHATSASEVCTAATRLDMVKKYDELLQVSSHYTGPLMGFTGLTLGEASVRGVDGVCLFARTTPDVDDPERPDCDAARKLTEVVAKLLELKIDASDFARTAAARLSFLREAD